MLDRLVGQFRVFSLVALVLSAVFLSGCQNSSRSSRQEDTLARIERTGQVDVCTAIYPPFAMKDSKTGALSGPTIDMMNIIGQKMNAKVIWHETTFGNAAADLQSGRCDVMAQYFNGNIPRAKAVAFTLPAIGYFGESALARKDDRRFTNIKDVYELDKPDITIAVATGEAGDIFVTENFKKAQIKRIDVESSDISRFCLEVTSHRADIAMADLNTIALFAKQHPESVDLFAGRPFSLNPASWAVRQEDVQWLHFLETALQFLDTQGIIDQLDKKYNAKMLRLVKNYKIQ